MLTALLIFGCTPEETEETIPTPPDDAPFIDPWEPVDVSYDASRTETSLQAAIDTVVELRSQPVIDAYAAVMAMASPTCPNMMYDLEGYTAWVDSCATETGVQFSGYAFTEAGIVDMVDYNTIALSATVSGGTASLSGSGYWGESIFEEGEVRYWGTYLEGQVLWDGPGADSWITQGIRPSLSIERSQFGEVPFTFVTVMGAVGGLDAPMATAEFIEVVMDDPACAEPVGTISVRDDDGSWFDVAFDGQNCDGCGTVSHLGEELGDACVTFDAWTGWEPTP